MSAESVTALDVHDDGRVECWCCGTRDAPSRMVNLGNHAEVRLCMGCAHFVHQQARQIEDAERRGPASRIRDRVRIVRAVVVRRGWQHDKFIGGRLRWLDRYVP